MLHVGSHPFVFWNQTVETILSPDIFRSVAPILPTLIEHYKVMIYNGQLDIAINSPGVSNFIRSLTWNGSEEWQAAKKVVWNVDPSDYAPAGYVTKSHEFVFVVVRGAGHILPLDQPDRALNMITRFVEGMEWE